ncbi:MAG: AarF/UbiB family protein [Sedimentibacter sp.]
MDVKNEKQRMHEILSVFFNHGIGKGLTTKNIPVSLRKSFEELGPTFIKIGQILSMRSDLLPEPYIKEFQKLQDDVKPEHFEDIKNVIENGLHKPIDDIFLRFYPEPIASASMAQVHLAYLKNETKVVVKIQRPKAQETMMSDIAILKRLAKHMKHVPQNKTLNFQEIIEELENSAMKEMDFLNEAENIKEFHENNADVKFITCPVVYDDYTTNNILVMDFIDGIKITDIEELSYEGYDINEICLKLANNYFKQIFEDGFFHADPHPGNILINKNKIAYVDFGMMGTLSISLRDKFNDFLFGLISGDIDEMTQAVLKISIKKGELNIKDFRSEIESVYNKYIEISLYDVDLSMLFNDIFGACRRSHLSVPREITILFKGIVTIEGVLEKLSPDINITEMLMPYIKSQMFKNIDIKRKIDDSMMNFYFLSKSGSKIIKKLMKLISNDSSSKLKIQIEHMNLESSVSRLNRMTNRVVFSIIVAAIIIGSSMIVSAEIGPKLYGISAIAVVGYVGALVMGLWLIISIIRSGM